ncbi:alpha/beta hydrolase [Actinokineospora cianjurensis]|uniref:alpha/beta hydrolase n=1 Tax=Actinokineospora cianjurensis TaxID=585224 RepID=UPI0014776F3D|nr:alpha/beta hydrolase [Actinokineospora cianjurensis]
MRKRNLVLIHSGDDLCRVVPTDGWTGSAADAARATQRVLLGRLETMAEATTTIVKALHQAVDAIDAVQSVIRQAEALAHRYDFTVSETGAVIDDFCRVDRGNPEDRKRAHDRVAFEIEQAIRTANEIDSDLNAAFHRGTDLASTSGTGDRTASAAAEAAALDTRWELSPQAPPPNGTAAQNATYWATLSPAAREAVLRDHPEWIGKLDGVPTVVRDRANRVELERLRHTLPGAIDELRREFAAVDGKRAVLRYGMVQDLRTPADHFRAIQLADRIEQMVGRLQGLDAISDRLHSAQPGQPPAYLLGLSAERSGLAIVAIGNPEHADNVATYVPGTFSGHDGFGVDLARAEVMQDAATKASPGATTAVITWAGYHAPQTIGYAVDPIFADDAEKLLRDFQDGLALTHDPGPVNTTVVGHSYGTTVIGHTARDLGLNADNLVFVASPGVGVEHASQLHLDGVRPGDMGGRVHATVSAFDPIGFSNIPFDPIDAHGPDPAMRDFGGRFFLSDVRSPVSAHGDYWYVDSASLRGMTDVIVGATPR